MSDPSPKLSSLDLTTTSPKLVLSCRLGMGLPARSPYGTGFCAASIVEMVLPLLSGATASLVRGPVSGQTRQMMIDRSSDPDL